MMGFNIDFLSHNIQKKPPRTHRTLQSITSEIGRVLNAIVLKSNQISVRKAFVKLVLFRKKKIQKTKVLGEILNAKLSSAFFNVLRFSLLSHQQQLCKINERLNYPVCVIQKRINAKRSEMMRSGWRALKVNLRSWANIRKEVYKIQDIFNEYIRRNLYSKGFRAMSSNLARPLQYKGHLKKFQYVFESARVRVLFDVFALVLLKTEQKHIVGLDKSKVQKREIAVKNYSKRSQIINELKRKINNLKGQVSEGQILNNKKRVDGAKQNGGKLIKKNEEMRIYQIGIAGLDYEIEKMEQQLTRKYNVIKSRNGNAISFEQLQKLYSEITYNIPDNNLKKQLAGKLIDNKVLKSFRESQNFIIMQNIKLKHLMALYQGVPDGKKNESYLNADSQNYSLKMLMGSIIKHELIEQERKEMEANVIQVQSYLIGLQDERQKLKREEKQLKALASK